MVESRLGEQGQRVGLLLGDSRRILGAIFPGGPAVQRLACRVERSEEQGADLWLQPTPEHDRAVVLAVDVKRAARVPLRGLAGFGRSTRRQPRTIRST